MRNNKKNNKMSVKSIATVALVGAVAVSAGVLTGINMVEKQIPEPVILYKNITIDASSEQMAQSFLEGRDSVEPCVPTNVSVPNPINDELAAENEDLNSEIALLEHDAQVFDEFLTYMEEHDDVDMDIFNDADDVIKNFMKEQRALAKVVEYVEDHIADELEDAGLVEDEDDVDFKKANIDYDEYEASSVDFDDNQFTFDFEVTVKNDGDTESYDVTAEFDDGEISISVE